MLASIGEVRLSRQADTGRYMTKHFICLLLAGSMASGISASVSITQAKEASNASEADVRWFAGRWAVGPADVAGYETITGSADCLKAAEIAVIAPGQIRRTVKLRNGEIHAAEFTVKRFGGNFPWWPDGGAAAPVARKSGDDTFLLARTLNGRADWQNALKHTRCSK